jgi:integrase
MQNGCVWLSRGVWYLRYREPVLTDGKLIQKMRCVRLAEYGDKYHCKSDLADLIAEKLDKVRASQKCPRSAELFSTYVTETYLPFVKRTMAPSTYACYDTYWRAYIQPHVTSLAMRDFSIAIVSKIIAEAASVHTLNKNTCGKIRSIISGVFSYAMKHGGFNARSEHDNPARSAAIPETATEPEDTHAATIGEARATLAHLEKMKMPFERTAIAIGIYCGLRPSEIAGLRWEDWNRSKDELHIRRAIVRNRERPTKTKKTRFVAVLPELRAILVDHHKRQGNPISGWILSRKDGSWTDMNNTQKRAIRPAFNLCATCGETEDAKHDGHKFRRDESLPQWNGFYSFRRFHGTEIRQACGSSETASRALGNSKEVFDKHYDKVQAVPSDVRKALVSAMAGLTA